MKSVERCCLNDCVFIADLHIGHNNIVEYTEGKR